MDISVLILFFNRPEVLKPVFDEVRKAQPARLFLYQDGPRGERDIPGIEACRKIVEQIDWPCEVHRMFQEKNYGCDPSEFISQRWAFSQVDKCIVLEDDDVPTQSFFRFCKEMLDRYENDDRIGMIQGCNFEERTDDADDADYFFSTNFCISGWASWSRVINQWDEHYTWLDEPRTVERLEQLIEERKLRNDFLPMARAHKASGKAYYETIFMAHLLLNSQLAIVPRLNLINNIGVMEDSVHFSGGVQLLPSGYRRFFTMKRYDLNFPLRHPKHILEHVRHRQRVYRIAGWRHPWIKVWRSFEELYLNMRHGQWKAIFKAIKKRIGILLHGKKFH